MLGTLNIYFSHKKERGVFPCKKEQILTYGFYLDFSLCFVFPLLVLEFTFVHASIRHFGAEENKISKSNESR